MRIMKIEIIFRSFDGKKNMDSTTHSSRGRALKYYYVDFTIIWLIEEKILCYNIHFKFLSLLSTIPVATNLIFFYSISILDTMNKKYFPQKTQQVSWHARRTCNNDATIFSSSKRLINAFY